MSRAMSGSSSMIRTVVRICSEISRPARSMRSAAFSSEQSMICAISVGPEQLDSAQKERHPRLKRDGRKISARSTFIDEERRVDMGVEGYVAPAAQEQFVEGDFGIEVGVETIGDPPKSPRAWPRHRRRPPPAFRTTRAQIGAKTECAARWRPRWTCRCSCREKFKWRSGLVHRQSRQLQALPFPVVKHGPRRAPGKIVDPEQ